ncbi:hypothetical protein [Mesorhizobium delmotii]|uniref:hypothetical protein n=1 Tax=Mesorhizobium delmotii TaxID=1631247 RepID=UPI001403EA22|nr:hypothetical protein [Mesorhizobium delmotii]
MQVGENPSMLAAKNAEPHQETGYTSAVVTVDPDPAKLLQSAGSIYRQMGNPFRFSLASSRLTAAIWKTRADISIVAEVGSSI